MITIPLHEYTCERCETTSERLFTKVSDVPETVVCKKCGGRAAKIMSLTHFRIGAIFSPGGPSIMDKDGHESLGMTGEMAEESSKQYHDMEQAKLEGKDPFECAVCKSPQRDMTDEEVYRAKHTDDFT